MPTNPHTVEVSTVVRTWMLWLTWSFPALRVTT